jgi:serine protease Do
MSAFLPRILGVLAPLGLALGLALAAGAAEPVAGDTRAFSARLLAAYAFVGTGSGVVVSADGLVLTNHHVIDGLDDFTVRFANGATRASKLLGTDPVGDIALLQLEGASDLPHVDLAPAEALRVGSEVVAIGNPFGLGDLDDVPTLTQGVLSAARIVRGDYTDAVQGDAPVNPGNSGGPLFDRAGRLLGINGQIRTVSGFRINSGIGLAIASTQLAAFLPLLQRAEGGYVHHTAAPKGLELAGDAEGVAVAKPGDSQLAAGDRLLRVAGRPAVSVGTAMGLFSSLPYVPGALIPVAVRREGTVLELSLPATRQAIPGRPYHGLSVDEQDERMVIDGVDEDSPAGAAKLRVGDTLASANGRPLAKKIDWIKALVKLEVGDWLELDVRGKDGERRQVRLLLRRH